MKTLAPGPRKREAIRAPSSPFIFRVFSLSPTVRLRSEPKCYRQSYRSATRSYYRFLLILIIFVSLTHPRLRVPASFKIGRRQVAIVLASVVLPHLFCALAFPFGIATRLGSPSPNSLYSALWHLVVLLHQQKSTFLILSYSILLHLIPLILGVRRE